MPFFPTFLLLPLFYSEYFPWHSLLERNAINIAMWCNSSKKVTGNLLDDPNSNCNKHRIFSSWTEPERFWVGRDRGDGIAICYRLMVLGSNTDDNKIFHACPDRTWGPSSLPYNGYRVFCGRQAAGRSFNHPTLSNEVKKVKSYTSTPPLELHEFFYCEFYLYTGSGTYSASFPIDSKCCVLRGKQAGHSTCSPKLKMKETLLPHLQIKYVLRSSD